MKDHKLVGLETRVAACQDQLVVSKAAVDTSEHRMTKELENYCHQIRGVLSSYQSLEHTRINIMKTLILDSIDAEEELASRKFELVKQLRVNINTIDARKDVDYFIKLNQSPSDPWQLMSGNVGRVVSKDLFPEESDAQSGNPMYSGYLPAEARGRLRSEVMGRQKARPYSLEVQKHSSARVQSNSDFVEAEGERGGSMLTGSFDQFQQHVSDQNLLETEDQRRRKSRVPPRASESEEDEEGEGEGGKLNT